MPEEALVDERSNRGEPHGEADRAIGITGEIIGELIVQIEARDEDVEAERTEYVRAREEVRMPGSASRRQAAKSHLGKNDGCAALAHRRLAREQLHRAFQEIERQLRRGTETAALDEDRLLVEDFRRLHDLAECGEHRRVGEA